MHDVLPLASFTDLLPQWAHLFVGTATIALTVMGIILWAAGLKIARLGVALLVGAIGASLGAWLLPQYLGMAAISGVLVGFALGALFGALAFRLLLGFALAMTLSIAVTGTYYRWHVLPEMHLATAAVPTTNSISDYLLPLDRFPLAQSEDDAQPPTSTATQPTTAEGFAKAVGSATSDAVGSIHVTDLAHTALTAWGDVPKQHQQRLTVLFLSIFAVSLLIAFGFPRHTTLAVSTILGSILIYAGIGAILHIYFPQYEQSLPWNLKMHYGILGGLMVVGMLLQYALFWPKRRKAAASPPVPVDATPVYA